MLQFLTIRNYSLVDEFLAYFLDIY